MLSNASGLGPPFRDSQMCFNFAEAYTVASC